MTDHGVTPGSPSDREWVLISDDEDESSAIDSLTLDTAQLESLSLEIATDQECSADRQQPDGNLGQASPAGITSIESAIADALAGAGAVNDSASATLPREEHTGELNTVELSDLTSSILPRQWLATLAAIAVDADSHSELLGRIDAAANRLGHGANDLELWQVLGFQSGDIASDFRGGGLLALHVLVHFLEDNAAEAASMLRLSWSKSAAANRLPLAITSINICAMLSDILLQKDNPCDHLESLLGDMGPIEAYARVHASALGVFLVVWCSSEASLLDGDFDAIMAAVRTSVAGLFAQAAGGSPTAEELAEWKDAMVSRYQDGRAQRHRHKGVLVMRAAGEGKRGFRNRMEAGRAAVTTGIERIRRSSLDGRRSVSPDSAEGLCSVSMEAGPSEPLPDKTDPELTAEDLLMLETQREEQLLQVRGSIQNAMVAGLDYRAWLQQDMRGDFDNEFLSTPTHRRQNKLWHQLWDEAQVLDDSVPKNLLATVKSVAAEPAPTESETAPSDVARPTVVETVSIMGRLKKARQFVIRMERTPVELALAPGAAKVAPLAAAPVVCGSDAVLGLVYPAKSLGERLESEPTSAPTSPVPHAYARAAASESAPAHCLEDPPQLTLSLAAKVECPSPMRLSRDLRLQEDWFGAAAGRSLEPAAGEDDEGEGDFFLISAPASPYGSSPRSALALFEGETAPVATTKVFHGTHTF